MVHSVFELVRWAAPTTESEICSMPHTLALIRSLKKFISKESIVTFLYSAEHEQYCRALVEEGNRGFSGEGMGGFLKNKHQCEFLIEMEARNFEGRL